MTTPISSSISTNRQINQTDSISANKASNSTATSLHNVQNGQQASDTEKNLVRAARSNGVSKMKAAHALEHQNLSTGPGIKSTVTTATAQQVMLGNQLKASVAQASLTPALKTSQGIAAAPGHGQTGISSLERNQTKALLTELITMIDRKEDKKTGAALSGNIYFTKGSQGNVHLQKVLASKDTPSVQKKYLASAESIQARELAGFKLESLFKKAGIEVTDEIRQALPGKTTIGNAAIIKETITNSLTKLSQMEKNEQSQIFATKKQTLDALKTDLSGITWSDTRSVENLFRGNTTGSKMLVGYLGATFTDSAKKCAAAAIKAGNECLKKTHSADLAMVAAHQTLLASLKDVHFTPELNDLAYSMMDLVDEVASEKMSQDPAKYTKETVSTIAAKAKEKMLSTIMLRTLATELTDELTLADLSFRRTAESLSGKAPPPEASFTRIGDKIQKLFNRQSASKTMQGQLEEMKSTSPQYAGFLSDAMQNNLEAFTALKQLSSDLNYSTN